MSDSLTLIGWIEDRLIGEGSFEDLAGETKRVRHDGRTGRDGVVGRGEAGRRVADRNRGEVTDRGAAARVGTPGWV